MAGEAAVATKKQGAKPKSVKKPHGSLPVDEKSESVTGASTKKTSGDDTVPIKRDGLVSRKGKGKEKKPKVDSSAKAPARVAKVADKSKSVSRKGISSKSSKTRPKTLDSTASDAEEGEEDVHLRGLSIDPEDSSDDEVLATEPPPIEISKLPAIVKDDATVRNKLERAKQANTEERGVVYLGRIPHGMYEDQLRGYFSQFGDITRLRLSRNKKTGHSKAYAFVEFASSAVAHIVAETMHNYLLLGHILVCHVVPKDQIHPKLWVGANRKYRPVPMGRLARAEHDRARDDAQKSKVEKRLLLRQERRKRKLAESGLDYDFEAVAYKKTNAIPA